MSGAKNQRETKPTLKQFLLVVAAVIVLLGGAFLIKTQVVEAGPCKNNANDPLYAEAAKVLKAGNPADMQKLVTKIQKIKNYKKSANCMYPITAYYIKTGDLTNAEAFYKDTVSVYKAKVGMADAYSVVGVKNIQDVHSQLRELEQQRAKNLNVGYF